MKYSKLDVVVKIDVTVQHTNTGWCWGRSMSTLSVECGWGQIMTLNGLFLKNYGTSRVQLCNPW